MVHLIKGKGSCIFITRFSFKKYLSVLGVKFQDFFIGRFKIRANSYLSKPHSINSSVRQGSIFSPVLFILFIKDLPSSTSSSAFHFADDIYLSSSFSSNPQRLAYSNISPYRNSSASLLTNDLTNVEKWG